VSFFDEGDETQQAPRPRRPAARGRPADRQTLLVRRAAAAAVGVLVLILLVVAVNSCVSNRRENALKKYARNVASLVGESNDEVAPSLFKALESGDATSFDLQTQVNDLRVTLADAARRARKLDVPSDMTSAQRTLVLALELRRDAVGRIGMNLPVGKTTEAAQRSIERIAGQMQTLLASDVIYLQRTAPLIRQRLDEADVGTQTIVRTRFLNDFSWLDVATVSSRLGAGGGGTAAGPIAPGTHGFGLLATSVAGRALTPGAGNTLTAAAGLTFDVRFQNQGENDERNIVVKVTITPTGGGKPVVAQRTVDSVLKGQTQTASIRLASAPPTGNAVTIKAEVVPVPGEKKTDNNSQSYPALFTR